MYKFILPWNRSLLALRCKHATQGRVVNAPSCFSVASCYRNRVKLWRCGLPVRLLHAAEWNRVKVRLCGLPMALLNHATETGLSPGLVGCLWPCLIMLQKLRPCGLPVALLNHATETGLSSRHVGCLWPCFMLQKLWPCGLPVALLIVLSLWAACGPASCYRTVGCLCTI